MCYMKKSNETQLQKHVYTDGENFSYDLIDIARKQKELTFDERYLLPGFNPYPLSCTPFKEIRWVTWQEACKYPYMLEEQPEFNGTFSRFIELLRDALKESIRSMWDPGERHLVFHSSGYDSRCLSLALAELRDEGFELGEIHFRCHQPECPEFVDIMQREGWREDQYSCYRGPEEDCYNVGTTESVNGWAGYHQQMNWWSDLGDDWVNVNGWGGEIFKYVAMGGSPKIACTTLNTNRIDGYRAWEGAWNTRFVDMLEPHMGYEYLKVAIKVRREWCKLLAPDVDKIRPNLAAAFNYYLPAPRGTHSYIFNISAARREEMKKLYRESKFYERYQMKIKPFKNYCCWDSRLWSFAVTIYEKLWSCVKE